jgi:hypothetical protein
MQANRTASPQPSGAARILCNLSLPPQPAPSDPLEGPPLPALDLEDVNLKLNLILHSVWRGALLPRHHVAVARGGRLQHAALLEGPEGRGQRKRTVPRLRVAAV